MRWRVDIVGGRLVELMRILCGSAIGSGDVSGPISRAPACRVRLLTLADAAVALHRRRRRASASTRRSTEGGDGVEYLYRRAIAVETCAAAIWLGLSRNARLACHSALLACFACSHRRKASPQAERKLVSLHDVRMASYFVAASERFTSAILNKEAAARSPVAKGGFAGSVRGKLTASYFLVLLRSLISARFR